ncbi:MAG: hypothetical protein GXP54_10530 [Deltaproteobacteria bacterium]|nr:hypothetical protein [Deltaproteobacteria bacterium]
MKPVFLNDAVLVSSVEVGGLNLGSGRMDLASRYVLNAAARLASVPEELKDGTGVFMGSKNGCLDVDLRFAATLDGRPSPRLFARTLPSTPAAEVAVRFGFKGPNTSIVQDQCAGLLALLAAIQDMESGACSAAIAGEYDVVDPELDAARGAQYAAVVLLADRPLSGNVSYRVDIGGDGTPLPPCRMESESSLRDLCAGLASGGSRGEFQWPADNGGLILKLVPVRGS